MSKKARLRERFDKQHGKRALALLKYVSQHLYHNHWLVPSQLSWKTSLLLTCQILGLLVNTLVTDEMYLVLNRDNITISIHMQLSRKPNTFSQFFAAFLKFRLNFEYFETKYIAHRFCISGITDSENVVREKTKKPRLRERFDKQHGKCAQVMWVSCCIFEISDKFQIFSNKRLHS